MPVLSRFADQGHRWCVDPAYEAFVREVLAPLADRVAELPGAQPVKSNKSRDVVVAARVCDLLDA